MEKPNSERLNPFDGVGEGGGESEDPVVPYPERTPADQLEHHWRAMEDVMATTTTLADPFVLEELREHLFSITQLVSKERPATSGRTGSCLEFLLSENIVENVYLFSTRQRIYGKEIRIVLLKFFCEFFTRSSQPVLIHQQILRPLSRLLRSCEGTEEKEVTDALVPLLHCLCMMIQENHSLLDLFFVDSKVHLQSKFLMFTQLIPHMHDSGEVGMMGRDALLLCLSLAAQLPGSNLGCFITTDSNFCQVLATGLSALYSDLPTSVEVPVDEWQSPLPIIESSVPQLKRFNQALDFCNSVLQVAPKVVCDSILSLVREGFLQQVLGPALLQNSEDAATFATAYLTIFLSHISNMFLMREFLRYICLGQYDGRSVLNAVILNISSKNDRLCCVTMELLYVLVGLNCEDVMLQLVLRYLLPGSHVMPNQMRSIASPDVYGQAARRFLQLIPSACINAEKMFLDTVKVASPDGSRTNSPPPPPTLTSSPAHANNLDTPTPIHLTVPKPSSSVVVATNPFVDLPITRPRSGSNSSCSSLTSLSSAASSNNPITHVVPSARISSTSFSTSTAHKQVFDYIPPVVSYFANLEAAREAIESCATCCRCWSSEYDGCKGVHERDALRDGRDVTPNGGGDLDSGGSSPRAVTVSSHSRESRAECVRNRDKLHPQWGAADALSNECTEHAQRTGSFSRSPRVSPTRSRRQLRYEEEKAGLFLKVLLEKLSNMLQHLPAVNLLLTRLVCRLAHYPQPLLRSLLLNHQLVLKSGVPNLIDVLQSIKVTVDGYARSQEGFEKRLGRARKTMIYWSKVRNEQVEESISTQIITEARQLRKQLSLVSELGDSRGGDSQSPKKVTNKAREGSVPRDHQESPKPRRTSTLRKKKKRVPTNSLFAIVIFDEFLRELAAISQEHSVLNPLLHLPKSV